MQTFNSYLPRSARTNEARHLHFLIRVRVRYKVVTPEYRLRTLPNSDDIPYHLNVGIAASDRCAKYYFRTQHRQLSIAIIRASFVVVMNPWSKTSKSWILAGKSIIEVDQQSHQDKVPRGGRV